MLHAKILSELRIERCALDTEGCIPHHERHREGGIKWAESLQYFMSCSSPSGSEIASRRDRLWWRWRMETLPSRQYSILILRPRGVSETRRPSCCAPKMFSPL